eukprot:jgi/Mesen1/3304/ME000191S02441
MPESMDARDVLLGRVFALGVLVRSGRIARGAAKGGASRNRSLEVATSVSEELLSLAAQKAYLREPATAVVLELAQQLDREQVAKSVLAAPLVQAALTCQADAATPEALLLALKLWDKLPAPVSEACPLLAAPGSLEGLFTRAHLALLVPALKASSHSHPRVHPVWQALVNLLLPAAPLAPTVDKSLAAKKKKGKTGAGAAAVPEPGAASTPSGAFREADVAAFMAVVVEGGLLTSSLERRHLAFEVVQLMLPRLPPSAAPAVLSAPLTRCLLMSLTKPDAHLHAAGRRCLSHLEQWAQGDSAARVALISTLQQHSRGRFDALSRTATVKRLAAGLDDAGCRAYFAHLQTLFLEASSPHSQGQRAGEGEGEDLTESVPGVGGAEAGAGAGLEEESAEVAAEERRRWAVEHMSSLPRQGHLAPGTRMWLQQRVLQFLLSHTLFDAPPALPALPQQQQQGVAPPPGREGGAISEGVRRLCKTRFLALLSHALQTARQQHGQRGEGEKDLQQKKRKAKKKKRKHDGESEDREEEEEEEEAKGAGEEGEQQQKVWKLLEELAMYSWQVQESAGAQVAQALSARDARALRGLKGCLQKLSASMEEATAAESEEKEKSGGKAAAVAAARPQQQLQQRVEAMAVLQGVVYLQGMLEPAGRQATSDAALDLVAVCRRAFAGHLAAFDGPADSDDKDREEEEEGEESRGSREGAGRRGGEGEEEPAAMDVLVDVLLSLLAQPSHPLRTAAEAAFAAFAEDLTPTALQDLLRVIGQQPSGGRRAPKVEEESESEDDEDDEDREDREEEELVVQADGDEEAADQESEEEDDDDSDSEDEEGAAGKVGQNGAAASSGEGGGGGILSKKEEKEKGQTEEEESEEEEEDLMDDEAMFRIDKHLEEILRQRKEAAGGSSGGGAEGGKSGGGKEERVQLEHFKLRALALLDTFMRRYPASPLALQAPLPLLEAMAVAYAPPGSPAVAGRIEGLLQQRLLRAKEYPRGAGVDYAQARKVVQLSLEVAGRTQFRQVARSAGSCSLWALKVLQGQKQQEEAGEGAAAAAAAAAEADPVVRAAFEGALEKFLVSKKCHLPRAFLEDAVSRQPWLGGAFAPTLLRHARDGRSEFVKTDALQLLLHIVQRRPPIESLPGALEPHLKELMALVQRLLVAESGKVDRRATALRFCAVTLDGVPALYPGTPLGKLVDVRAMAGAVASARDLLGGATTQGKGKGKILALLKRVDDVLRRVASAPSPGAAAAAGVSAGSKGGKKPHAQKQEELESETRVVGEPATEHAEKNGKSKKRKEKKAAEGVAAAGEASLPAAALPEKHLRGNGVLRAAKKSKRSGSNVESKRIYE